MEEAICLIVMVIIMTENIEHKKFIPFILDDVFDIYSSNSGIDKNKLKTGAGDIPYITRTDRNNGIDSFVCEQDSNKYKKDSGNVITIGLDTQTVFYQQYDFYTGQNIQILSNPNLTFESSLYIIPLLKMVLEKFSWGSNGATLARLKRSKIMLPANNKDEPDFNYMANYIKESLFKETNDIKKYCRDLIKNIKLQEIENLKNKTWSEFKISHLFDVTIGKAIDGNKVDKWNGNIAYITRKESNNALDGFIDYDYDYINKNHPVITIGNETAKPFVQTYPFFTGTKVNIMKPKFKANKYILIFISQALEQHKDKYSYSYTINSTRLKEQIILLPVNEDGNPDYAYMEQYIKNIMYNQYKRYLEFLED